MRPLIRAPKRHRPKVDPAPSRWAWRRQRLMLTPGVRFGLRFGVPFALMFAVGTVFFTNPVHRAALEDTVAAARAAVQERPEFMVHVMAIDGADTPTATVIRDVLSLDFPQSSFDLILPDIRATVESLPPVKEAAVRIRPGGILQIDVIARTPVAVWRGDAGLFLVDDTGVQIGPLAARSARPDLPMIAGDGAPAAVQEALALVQAARLLGPRLRGLVRMGARRWDVVLDRDQRILLPEKGGVAALERVIALEQASDLLARDITRIDMRLASRATIQMKDNAAEAWRRIKQDELNGQ